MNRKGIEKIQTRNPFFHANLSDFPVQEIVIVSGGHARTDVWENDQSHFYIGKLADMDEFLQVARYF